MRRLVPIAALILIASACGGTDTVADGNSGDVPNSGDAAIRVESADGAASIRFQQGSLPEGFSADDVTLTAIVNETGDEAQPLAAVKLEPHGLVLSAPAEVTINLDGEPPGGVFALHQSDGYVEFLAGAIVADGEGWKFTAELSSFSSLFLGAIKQSIDFVVDPPTVVVGQAQTARGELGTLDSLTAWFHLPTDDDGTFRYLRFSVEKPLTNVRNVGFGWGGTASTFFVENPIYPDATENDGTWVAQATSTCVTPVSALDVYLNAVVDFNITIESISEPQISGIGAFIEVFGESRRGIFPGGGGEVFGLDSLRDAEVFDTIAATAVLKVEADTTCLEAGVAATSSTTTTTTLPPDGSVPDEKGDNEGSGSSNDGASEADKRASDLISYKAHYDAQEGCYVFTMKVDGDGKAMASAATTKWYNPQIVINNDPDTNFFIEDAGGFKVDISLDGDAVSGRVTDANRESIDDAVVTGKWVDSSTLEITVKNAGDAELINSRVELTARTKDADGNTTATFGDDAYWPTAR